MRTRLDGKGPKDLAREELEKVRPGGVEWQIKKAQTYAMLALVEAIEKLNEGPR